MIHLILLAAGSSRRFGGDKLRFPVDGVPMLRRAAGRLMAVRDGLDCDITVVVRADRASVLPDDSSLRIVLNPDAEQGVSTSIRCALRSLPDDGAPAAFFVADQPYLKEETILGFLRAFLASGLGLGCVSFGERTGNPAAFQSRYFPELLALTGDRGGKRVLLKHPEDCLLYEVSDEKELEDIDTRG